eukprot:TRINITY_DN6024_c0_g1_i6.p1 TRINITY_DN6024_c0_g1~~TRINITY_DN6024_c0_g1_i6.p1  ORF type:complete len:227 (-),score=51.65 TRINITY_DN6024_c0_g1_i6:221-901(-)
MDPTMLLQVAGLVSGIHVVTLVLHLIIPVRPTPGYACDNTTGEVLQYRNNGTLVLLATSLLWAVAGPSHFLYQNYAAAALCSCVFGMIFSIWMMLRPCRVDKKSRCLTTDGAADRRKWNATAEEAKAWDDKWMAEVFWEGREWNPRAGGVDLKMWLYLCGAIMLQINVMSALFEHARGRTGSCTDVGIGIPVCWGYVSNAAITTAGCLLWFVAEYLHFERVPPFIL